MAITSANLKFIASERMIDNLSPAIGVGGGGNMSETLIVDGVENNVFPDVSPGARASGGVQLRQVYPIVLSADNDTLSGASAGLSGRQTDNNVHIVAFTIPSGNLSAQASSALGTRWTDALAAAHNATLVPASGSSVVRMNDADDVPPVGSLVYVTQPAGVFFNGVSSISYAGKVFGMRVVTAVAGEDLTLDGALIAPSYAGTSTVMSVRLVRNPGAGTRISSVALTVAATVAGVTSVDADRLHAQVQLAGQSSLDSPGEPSARSGTLPMFLPGDAVLIEHASVPTTRELATVESVNFTNGFVTFTAPLANAYAAGSKLTRPVPLGEGSLRAAANNVFAQQTWTRSFSDAPIGAGTSARYGAAVGMTNEGGITNRWAIVFTNSTAFNLISEMHGQIASGTTAANFAPLNPLTNQPYFTLYAAGWGSGWVPGNTLRFNTVGATAPMWLSRLVKPSAPGGSVQATLFMRGDVNA